MKANVVNSWKSRLMVTGGCDTHPQEPGPREPVRLITLAGVDALQQTP